MRHGLKCLLLVCIVLIGACTGRAPESSAGIQRLTIDGTQPLSRIDYPFWGVNYVAFWDPIQGSAASMQAMRNAGVQILRFPGGEPANWHDWSRPTGLDTWTSTDTADLAAYAEGVGAQLFLQTNPTRNPINDQDEPNNPDPAHAAAWVAYVREQAIPVPFWEIGNEPDLTLTRKRDRAALQWYFDAFNAQAAAMRAADPRIMIFGPAGTNAYQWWGLESLELFLEQTGNKQGSGQVDGISLHYYYAHECTDWAGVQAAGQSWARNMDYIQQVIAAYDTRPLPVFITETNAAVGALYCPINQTMAAALANADLLGAFRASGVQAVHLFGAIHGANGWGLLYGANEGRSAETPTPTYFILPIWTQSGNTVLHVDGLSDPTRTLSAYASHDDHGATQVLLINKSATDLTAQIVLTDRDLTGAQLRIFELRPANGTVDDSDVFYNGVLMPDIMAPKLPEPATETVSAATLTRTLPPYSITLLEIGEPAPDA